MVYRKGEKPIERTWPDWDCGWHPVRQMIESGDTWFRAWYGQASTPWVRLSGATGIGFDRFFALDHGAKPTEEEVRLLASAWRVDPQQVFTSIQHGAA